MKVIMTKNTTATIDGFKIRYFKAGEIHDLREFTSSYMISRGEAVVYESELQANMIRASLPQKTQELEAQNAT